MKIVFLIVGILFAFTGSIAAQNKGINEKLGPAPGKYKTSQKGNIEIPFEMYHDKPRIEARINGQKVHLTIDNGRLWDEVLLFGGPKVDSLKLKKIVDEVKVTGAGSGDGMDAYSTEPITVSFNGIEFTEQPNIVTPGLAELFEGFEGQICNTFFKHFVVEFNYDKMKIILHKPEEFNYKGKGISLPLTLMSNGAYSIPVSIEFENGTVINAPADIDLGGIENINVNLDYDKNIKLPSNAIEIVFGYGVSGPMKGYKGRLNNIKLGKYNLSKPLANFGKKDVLAADSMALGVIGLPLFRRFNFIFDYLNSKVYLTPNAYFGVESQYNMTGFSYTGSFTVSHIYPNSPAEKAGIKKGDKILTINGIPANGMDIWKNNELFRQEGKIIKFGIKRGVEKKEISLRLKKII